jgi:hypothetical protein
MRAQTKATVAAIMTGAIGAHCFAPTIGQIWLGDASVARCDVLQRVAGFNALVDCESGSAPPLASVPLSIPSSSIATVTGSAGTSIANVGAAIPGYFGVRYDAITDIDYAAGMQIGRGGSIGFVPPRLLDLST